MNAEWRTAVDTARAGVVRRRGSLATLPDIVAGLHAGGMAGDTPAAAIQHGTTSGQRQLVTTLARLPAAVAAAGLASPAVLVIGDVVATARSARCAALQVAA